MAFRGISRHPHMQVEMGNDQELLQQLMIIMRNVPVSFCDTRVSSSSDPSVCFHQVSRKCDQQIKKIMAICPHRLTSLQPEAAGDRSHESETDRVSPADGTGLFPSSPLKPYFISILQTRSLHRFSLLFS